MSASVPQATVAAGGKSHDNGIFFRTAWAEPASRRYGPDEGKPRMADDSEARTGPFEKVAVHM